MLKLSKLFNETVFKSPLLLFPRYFFDGGSKTSTQKLLEVVHIRKTFSKYKYIYYEFFWKEKSFLKWRVRHRTSVTDAPSKNVCTV